MEDTDKYIYSINKCYLVIYCVFSCLLGIRYSTELLFNIRIIRIPIINQILNVHLQFSGTWHEVSRFPSELRQGTCSTKSLNRASDIDYTFYTSSVNNERLFSKLSSAKIADDGRGVITTELENEYGGKF